MKVLILGINYAPEPTGIAPYTTGLAKGLACRGHDVRVLTGCPHYPQWQRDTSGGSLRTDEWVDGVRVRRLNHTVPKGPSWTQRLAMEITFGLQLLTSTWGDPDVVICVTPPLLASAMAVTRARAARRGLPVGVVVHDLYGRGVTEIGATSARTASLVTRLESATLRSADGVTVIHPGFVTDLIDGLGVDPRKVREIRNWNHVKPPDPAASNAFRRRHRWSADETVVLHAGNMGHKQGLENVIAAAKLADREHRSVRFVLLGDGNQRAALQSAAAGVTRLQFLPPVSEEDFPAALGAADVLLVNERRGVAQMAVPSKLTSYFMSGRPTLAATETSGLTAGEIVDSGAGIRVPADRPDVLLREALRLGADRELARTLGEAGVRYCAARLSSDAALDSYERWIMDLTMHRGGENCEAGTDHRHHRSRRFLPRRVAPQQRV